MVTTRKSTGSLPAPKRKNLADSDYDEGDLSEEDYNEKHVRKRAKKEQATTSTQNDAKKPRHRRKASKGDSGKRLNRNDSDEEELSEVDSKRSDVTKKKPGRMDSLITGPESKSIWLFTYGGPLKSSRKKSRIRKGDLGKLSRMTDLPVDVFCEIASYLKPDDLLRLSRTSRPLRDFLMSKSSRPIWVACEAAIGMPPCPSDLNEPQYANLYFEKDCHACGHPRVERMMDHLRIRLCKGCSQLNLVQGQILRNEFGPHVSKMYEIYTLLPWNSIMGRYNSVHPTSLKLVSARSQKRYFLKHDLLKVVNAYLSTKPDSEERRLFVEERHKLVEEVVENVNDIRSWQAGQYSKRVSAEEELRKNRKMQIMRKFRMLGYSREEFESMDLLPSAVVDQWKRLVDQPRELTDRIWKSIQPKLENLIQSKRRSEHDKATRCGREKRKSELLELYREYVEQHPVDKKKQVAFCYNDLCTAPMVSELIEEDDCSIEMTRERWEAIEVKLSELSEAHSRKIERYCSALLLSVLPKLDKEFLLLDVEVRSVDPGTSDADIDMSIVWRATSFFGRHRPSFDVSSFADITSEIHQTMFNTGPWRPWDAGRIIVKGSVIQVATALLSSLGLPEDTTMEHMTSLGTSFVCQQCHPVFRKCMTWRELVGHVASEIQDYQCLHTYLGSDDIPLIETHKIESDGTTLVAINPDFIEHPVESFTYATESIGSFPCKRYCTLCWRGRLNRGFVYREQLAAHVLSHHGVDPENF